MAIPETDSLPIGICSRARVPQALWNEVRVECEIADRHVTIVETRQPWDGEDRPWTRFLITRLRYSCSHYLIALPIAEIRSSGVEHQHPACAKTLLRQLGNRGVIPPGDRGRRRDGTLQDKKRSLVGEFAPVVLKEPTNQCDEK